MPPSKGTLPFGMADAVSSSEALKKSREGLAEALSKRAQMGRTPTAGPVRFRNGTTRFKTRGGAVMSSWTVRSLVFALLFALWASSALAQMPNPYGAPIGLENAKKAAAASLAEARKNNWTMAVAITDIAGDLVYFEKMDGTQTGSVNVAQGKARSAALFKRPSRAFQDVVAGGGAGLRILGLEGAVPIEGGIPLVMDGKVVGAIGLSGGTSDQDGQCAKMGVDAVK